jgi:DNA helicase II / ATP-dependent DNA helicase PcrA
MEDPLQNLTGAQREAVLHHDGPLLILAGPGSGKTRVVTHRIARMLADGVAGQQILALTFTNKAAEEMRLRVQRLAPGSQVWIGTFHRFCARLLRKYAQLADLEENYTIYDTGDSSQALRRAMSHSVKADGAFVTPEAVARAISWAKNNLIAPDQYQPKSGNPLGSVIQKIYPAYQAKLRDSNAVDFDDLLLHVATMLRESPEVRASLDERHRFIMVDEYQDTNLAQYAIARSLSIDHPNLAVTGDPDQAIYGWRGANLNNILDFEKDFPNVRVVRLERNYRSTKRILRVADELISYNLRRKKKALFTENAAGEPVRLATYRTHKEEADAVAGEIAREIAGGRRARDFAVFYRTNALSRSFEFALREAGVPYQLVNGVEFFQRAEIKDVLAYLQLVNNPHDEVALRRVINTPARGIGKTTIDRLAQFADQRRMTLLDAAREAKKVEAVSARAAKLVTQFVHLFDRLLAAAHGRVEEVLGLVLIESGYEAVLKGSGDEEDEERLANIQELLTVAREFDERRGPETRAEPGGGQLEAFLEETALVNETDAWETQIDRVTLMTLHAAKGLEFPWVYIVAVEEGLLPHERSRDKIEQLEEERRLMFVGITRAQQRLQISLAQYREFRGVRKPVVPSSFLMELPRGEMEVRLPEATRVVEIEPSIEMEDHHELHEDHEPVFRRDEPKTAAAAANLGTGLRTAAEMANNGRREPVDPDVFRQGMVVLHPQYGMGKVVSLCGDGGERSATIDFASAAGRMNLALAGSELRPVK